MRNLYCFIAAVALTLASCTEDELYDKESSVPADLQTLYASTVVSSKSRVNINGFDVTWSAGDQFTVYDVNGSGVSQYLLHSGAGTNRGQFNVVSGGSSVAPVVALFPNLPSSLKGNKLSVTLPDTYDAAQSQNIPMVGSLKGNQVQFHHSLAAIRFNFTNLPEGFNTIQIRSTNVVTGAFMVEDISKSKSLVRERSNSTGKTVTILNFKNDELFYLPVPAIRVTKMEIVALKGSEEMLLQTLENQSFKNGLMYTLTKDGLQTHNDCEELMTKIRFYNQKSISNNTVSAHLAKFNAATGAFTDVNYSDKSQTNWAPLAHVERLSDWAFAYTNEQSSYYASADLYNKIVKGLEYWNKTTTYSTNWWYKDLKEPQILGLLLVQMRIGTQTVPSELETALLEDMHKTGDADPANKTGANCTDVALHWLYRGCLSEDMEVIDHALTTAFATCDHTTGEGIQADNSFFQHGSQIYFGGYGDEFIKGITQIALLTSGTKFALQGERLNNLSNFMRKGFFLCLRDGYMPFGVLGRSVSRPDGIRKTGTAKYALRMMDIDPAHKQEYQTIADRLDTKPANYGVEASHTHFHRADYTLHVRPEYTFDVRMSSKSTARCEWGNDENLKGYYIADGSTNILVSGKEYFNIFPTWNWRRVPGTTAPQGGNFPKNAVKWGAPGMSYVVGGVSDGRYGVSAMNYMDSNSSVNTGTHKSWYFFDDEVVCLGVVNSTSTYSVQSTINQCLSTGSVTVATTMGQEVSSAANDYDSPRWVHHDRVGYIFPQGGKVWVSNVSQSGSWYDINLTKGKKQINTNVFSLGFNYSTPVNNASYAYIVLPAVTSPSEVESYCQKNVVEIVDNSYYVQSVYHKTLKLWGISFLHTTHQTVTFNGITVTANRHCTVMVKDKGAGQYEVWTANIARSSSDDTPLELTFTKGSSTQTLHTGLTGHGPMGGVSANFSISL